MERCGIRSWPSKAAQTLHPSLQEAEPGVPTSGPAERIRHRNRARTLFGQPQKRLLLQLYLQVPALHRWGREHQPQVQRCPLGRLEQER